MRNLKPFLIWLLVSAVVTIACWQLFLYFEIELFNCDEEIIGFIIALVPALLIGIVLYLKAMKTDDNISPGLYWFFICGSLYFLLFLIFEEYKIDFEHYNAPETALVTAATIMIISGIGLFAWRYKKRYLVDNPSRYGMERIVICIGVFTSNVLYFWLWFAKYGIDAWDLDEESGGIFTGLLITIGTIILLIYWLRGKAGFAEQLAYMLQIILAVNLIVFFVFSPKIEVLEEFGVSYKTNWVPVTVSSIVSVLALGALIAYRRIRR